MGSFASACSISHTDLMAFSGVAAGPTTSDDMVFTSFRYYPF